MGFIDTILVNQLKDSTQISNLNDKIENWYFSNKENLFQKKNAQNLTFDNLIERATLILKEMKNKKIKIEKFSIDKVNLIEINT